MNRKLLLAILISFTIVSLAACGSGSSNPTEISFNVAPPADLQVGGTATISATVFNNNNTGVNWTVSCGSADCGSFNPTSGASTVYTAPAAVPSGNTVTITATAAAKSSVTVMATVTITSSSTGTALNGQYVFAVSGMDSSGNYFAAGSIDADGNGNITGGEEDLCDFTGCGSGLDVTGTFSTGSDGRGSINISSTGLGSETFDIVLTSTSHALIIEFDGNATSSGTLDLQDSTALAASAISGGYSMTLNGVDISSGTAVPNAFGFVMTGDGSGGFPSVTVDQNDGGTFTGDQSDSFSVQSGPDSFGRVAITDGSVVFAYYIVNAKALRVVEVDGIFLTSGSAYTEGTGTLSVASLTGSSVFSVADQTSKGTGDVTGEFTSSNNGSISPGFMDVNDDGSIANGSITGSTFANFSGARGTLSLSGGVSSNISGFQVYLVDPGVNILDPTNSTGGGALLLDSDANAVGTGTIIPQTSGAQFNGNYGLNLQGISATSQSTFAENDLEGQVAASGNSALMGNGDLNNFGNTLSAQALSGSFTADSNNPGRFTGSLTVGSFGTFSLVFYQATNSQIVIVEIDKGQIGTGVLLAQ